MLGWTTITPVGSHLRSSRMAPCLSNGRLPSLADASELRDVEIKCKGGGWHSYKGGRSEMAPSLARRPLEPPDQDPWSRVV